MRRINRWMAAVIASGMLLTMTACGSTTSVSKEAVAVSSVTETPEPTEKVMAVSESLTASSSSSQEEEKVIGEKSEGEAVVSFDITNRMAEAITGVAVKYTQDGEYGDNMMPSGEIFATDETRKFYYDETDALAAANGDASSASDQEAPLINPVYSVMLTMEDGTQFELHDVPVDDIKSCEIMKNADSTYAYLSYVSEATGEVNSTEENEKAAWEAAQVTPEPTEQADPTAAPETTQTETGTTYTAPSTQNTTVTQQPAAAPQTETPQTEAPQTDVPQATAAPVQTDGGADSGEGCIDDGLTW